MTILIVLVLAMAVLLLICVLALMDQYRTLELVRDKLGISEQPAAVTHPDVTPDLAAMGLGHLVPSAPRWLALFLSTTCNSCTDVGMYLADKPSDTVLIVLRAPSPDTARSWCDRTGMAPDRIHIDSDGAVGAAFEVTVNPSVYLVQGEDIVLAQTVPTPSQLLPLLDATGIESAIQSLDRTGADAP